MDVYKLIAIGLGGFLGSIARYLTVKNIEQKINMLFPYGTLAVNVIGSLAVGIIYAIALRKTGVAENWRLFLGVGFCGGFTTFSAFAWENANLFMEKMHTTALVYSGLSLILTFAAVMLGIWIGKAF
jgi:fluoride exporter